MDAPAIRTCHLHKLGATRRIHSHGVGVLLLLTASVSAGGQTTYYVNATCGDDAWTGLDPNCVAPDGPKRTIQAGIDATTDGDTVLVADGVYGGSSNRELDFGGKGITVRSENGPDSCVIDCGGWGPAFEFLSGEPPTAVVEGFTISNAWAWSGSAIYCVFSSPTIANCVIEGGSTGDWEGGAIFCLGGNPTITGCAITGHVAIGGWGGGVFLHSTDATITNCLISDNEAMMGHLEGYGGGICVFGGSPVIANCVVSSNVVTGTGGPGIGGGIACTGGSPVITNCTISGNSGTQGGGVWCSSSSAVIANCVITGNTASRDRGGGVCSAGVVSNCVIAGNTARRGGGILCGGPSPTVTKCTIVGNTADDRGGGLHCLNATATVANSVLWGNTAPLGPEIALGNQYDPVATLTVFYSDVQGGQAAAYVHEGSTLNWGTGNIEADPLWVDPAGGDYHVTEDSPCVDAGDPNFVPEPGETDIDGQARVIDIPWITYAGRGPVDMGSDEYTRAGDLDFDGDVDLDDFGMFAACYNGSARPAADTCPEGVDADLDGDVDVDLDDFGIFAANYTGSM